MPVSELLADRFLRARARRGQFRQLAFDERYDISSPDMLPRQRRLMLIRQAVAEADGYYALPPAAAADAFAGRRQAIFAALTPDVIMMPSFAFAARACH